LFAAETLIGIGQVIVGGCASVIVTVNEQLFELPAASLTVQVTVVVPFAKVEPDEGVQLADPTPGQLSAVAGVP